MLGHNGLFMLAANRILHRSESGARRLTMRTFLALGLTCLLAVIPQALLAQESSTTTLNDLSIASLPGEAVQLTFEFSGPPPEPLAFTVDDPARIALDFPGIANGLTKRNRDVGIGVTRSINTAEAQGRTRAVVSLSKLVPYQTQVIGNQLIMTIGSQSTNVAGTPAGSVSPFAAAGDSAQQDVRRSVRDIDFRRGQGGEGRIIVKLSDPNTPINLTDQKGRVVLDILNTRAPKNLQKRLDVVDFATPAQSISTYAQGDDVRIVIEANGKYEQLAYQSDDVFTVEIKPIIEDEAAAQRRQQEFTGERLSLNFQDIEVRSVLQLIADFTGLNVVVSDSVQGSLTLRLKRALGPGPRHHYAHQGPG